MPQKVLSPLERKKLSTPLGQIPEYAPDKETSLLHYFHPRDCKMTLVEDSGKIFS